MKLGKVVSETFKDYTVLYMYIAQGQETKFWDKILIVTKIVTTLLIHCKFQHLVL